MTRIRRTVGKAVAALTLGLIAVATDSKSARASTSILCYQTCTDALADLSNVCPWDAPASCAYNSYVCPPENPAYGYCDASS